MTLMHVWLTILLLASACSPFPVFEDLPSLAHASLLVKENAQPAINDCYIVVVKDDSVHLLSTHLEFIERIHATYADLGLAMQDYGIKHVYDGLGYAGRFTLEILEQIRQQPEVSYIEPDQVIQLLDWKIQNDAPWNLARINHRKISAKQGRGGSGRVSFIQESGADTTHTTGASGDLCEVHLEANPGEYRYDSIAGRGVNVYVLDTGVNIHHHEFEGRAEHGVTIPSLEADEDEVGHGTHCAGIVAGRTYGVAKEAKIIAVKVMRSTGFGVTSDLIAGINWVKGDVESRLKAASSDTGNGSWIGRPIAPSIMSMSLGGPRSKALSDAVNKAVDVGIVAVVAAGNESQDACNTSPANAEKAITVAASSEDDELAYFSNHGPCVDVIAPGVDIPSSFAGGDDAVQEHSGTSMAAPHVAGLAAYFISLWQSANKQDPASSVSPTLSALSDLTSNKDDLWHQAAYQHGDDCCSRDLILTNLGRKASRNRAWAHEHLSRPIISRQDGSSTSESHSMEPAAIRALILEAATAGVVKNVPHGTPNMLIFNNVTDGF